MLRVAWIETLAEIDHLRSDWTALERRTPEATGFQSFVWCRQWLATADELQPGRIKPRIVTVHDDERLVMLWPLQIVTYAALRVARWIGEPMTQYGDALAEPGAGRAAWHAAAETAMRRWRDVDLILLKNLRADGVLAGCGAGMALVPNGAAPFIDLTVSPGVTKQRSINRRTRRLAARGPLSFEQPIGSDARLAATGEALALKRDWLRDKRLYSRGLSHPLTAPFLEKLAGDGALDIAVLRVGDDVAAVELGLCAGRSYRSLLSAFDRRFAEGAPGHALTTHLIENALAKGMQRFDFLAPADDYKLKWATDQTALGTATFTLSWLGHAGLFALRLRPLAKGLVMLASRLSKRVATAVPQRPRQRQVAISG